MSESAPRSVRPPTDTELLSTLFDLGRDVMSVLDLEELLARIPQLIARLTHFSAFSVYLLDEAEQALRIAYAIGYPEEITPNAAAAGGPGCGRRGGEEGRRFSSTTSASSPVTWGRCGTCCRSSPCRCGAKARSSAP
jgi:hypothetical protein